MIGAVIAMQSEADILLNQMNISSSLNISGKNVHIGNAFGKDIAVCVCGVGKVNAALGTQLLISKFDVKTILNFGVAGSLNNNTKLCQIYQITGAVQFDFDLVQLNGTKIGTLNEYTENYLALNILKIFSKVGFISPSNVFILAKAAGIIDVIDSSSCLKAVLTVELINPGTSTLVTVPIGFLTIPSIIIGLVKLSKKKPHILSSFLSFMLDLTRFIYSDILTFPLLSNTSFTELQS